MRDLLLIPLYFLTVAGALGFVSVSFAMLQQPLLTFASEHDPPEGKSPRIEAWKARLLEEKEYSSRRAREDAREAKRVKALFASPKPPIRIPADEQIVRVTVHAKDLRKRAKKAVRSRSHIDRNGEHGLSYSATSDRAQYQNIFSPVRDSSRDGS